LATRQYGVVADLKRLAELVSAAVD